MAWLPSIGLSEIPDVTLKIQRLCKLVKAIDDMMVGEMLGKVLSR
jgi:hypothetical protein